jgi:hypothetical protein
VELKLLRLQLKSQEDTFIQSANQIKIEFYVLKILFMEEHWQQYTLVDQRK